MSDAHHPSAAALAAQNAELRQRLTQLEYELNQKASSGNKDAMISLLKIEVSRHVKAAADAEHFKAKVERIVADQQRRLLALDDERQQLMEDAQMRRANLAETMEELDALKKQMLVLQQSQQEDKQQQEPQIEAEKDAVDSESTALKEQLEAAESRVAELEQAASASSASGAEAAAEASSLKEQLEAAQSRVAELEQAASASTASGAEAAAEASSLKEQLEAAQSRVAELEQAASASTASGAEAAAEASSLKEQLEAAQSRVAELEQAASASTASGAEAAAEASSLKEQLEAAQSRVAELEKSTSAPAAAVSVTEETSAILTSTCADLIATHTQNCSEVFLEQRDLLCRCALTLLEQMHADAQRVARWKGQVIALNRKDADTIVSLKQELGRRDRDVRELVEKRRQLHQLIGQLPGRYDSLRSAAVSASMPSAQNNGQPRDVLDDLFSP